METNPLATMTADTPAELAAAVFQQKAQRRQSLAALPVEVKYQHFLQLQRMVASTLNAAGKACPPVWPLEVVKQTTRTPFVFGLHAGMMEMSPDFDDPLPDSFWLGEDQDETAV